jgi:hypothetical protein
MIYILVSFSTLDCKWLYFEVITLFSFNHAYYYFFKLCFHFNFQLDIKHSSLLYYLLLPPAASISIIIIFLALTPFYIWLCLTLITSFDSVSALVLILVVLYLYDFNAQRGELRKAKGYVMLGTHRLTTTWIKKRYKIPSQMITPHIRQSKKYEKGDF